ncbi:MAG TPA: DNA topoisomerase VI subunit B [Candidatus Krumholzibacteria bacterium]|nr:DNA topoisomerase VI subunit B [Candidatus Krumholzibacteria bacterium]HPD70781.1 DNA topoisomerase VI subunit B [Candidatus Krumholzibacteria bacterium]HRY39519.1 DNA topoisomerase VI subunit B [Candidatus Krumholzibacteria bacterium]
MPPRSRTNGTAETLAQKQREISISEFFTKNRHLLGFDSPAKALLTTIKEAVDNSLDACEEAGHLPRLHVEIRPEEDKFKGLDLPSLAETAATGATATGNGNGNGKSKGKLPVVREERYRVVVEDNGPGIVAAQVPRIFGKLLYGSKFHSLKQSRGQQGIGISAAGMYGQLTTGKPVTVYTRTAPDQPARRIQLHLDMKLNEPVVQRDEETIWEKDHGTRVEIVLTGSYKRGQHSVDAYLAQTAIANPHLHLTYVDPKGEAHVYPNTADQLPAEAREIQPHPYGVELGLLARLLKDTACRNLGSFLREEFCRVGPKTCEQILGAADLPANKQPKRLSQDDCRRLLDAIAATRIPAPPTDCLSPIGESLVMAGLKSGVAADFYTSVTRPAAVYRGNPFQVEVGLAYGGQLPGDELATLMRFANRVPLLYQASACAIHKAVLTSNWRAYGVQQSKGALPTGPLVILVHIASVWVPFTSESKEAVAHYPEIVRELKLALQEAGRQLGRFLRRRQREKDANQKQSYIQKYIPHIGDALQDILALDAADRANVITVLTETLEKSRKF